MASAVGIESPGVPLEKKEGKLVLNPVRGKLPASEYHYDSGGRTIQEIRLALGRTMDIDREYLLIFYALCRKESDGQFVFDAPYYGDTSGLPRSGVCHAADCELLDPLLLTATDRRMVFTEHYYPRREMSVAQFNSWYLGGTATSLVTDWDCHTITGVRRKKKFGISLMGEGNLTYRQELWGKGPPTYLGRASALQLLAHPLITGTDHGRWEDAKSSFRSLNSPR